jgi:arsenate reductase (thioredoxin)
MSVSAGPELRVEVERIAQRLATEFAGLFSRETIARYAQESAEALSRGAKVHRFIPAFVEGLARERLRALAQGQRRIVTGVPEVLFVCVHNAGRSQMAAALLNHHARGRAHARSAGSAPGDRVNPAVITAMAERGLDLSRAFSKPLTDEVVEAADVVVTMGCGDACPLLRGKTYLDWALSDPAGKSLENVRAVRDEIERRVLALLDTFGAPGS